MTRWRHPPLRWLWRARLTRILMRHPFRWSLRQAWPYSGALAEMLDEPLEAYYSPEEALSVDRQYWSD